MNPTISIIVPVYNTEQYLNRCIDSILSQSFTNFELLLIDDGSTDKSGDICDEYARKDERIKVFHKKNGGVSSARNMGLDFARGEWITFVDSDDYIDSCFLYRFNNRMKNACFDLYFGNSAIITPDGEFQYNKLLKTDIICDLILAIDFYSINKQADLHGKVFKKSILLLYSIRFKEGIHYAEDV